jgi:hypothetical protein
VIPELLEKGERFKKERKMDSGRSEVQVDFESIAKNSAECEPTAIQAVSDRYRCPEGFLNYRLGGPLLRDSGYFQFGPGTTCYGQSTEDSRQALPSAPLLDSLPSVRSDGTQLVLPFDPDEIIDNLRLEHYPAIELGTYENLLKRIYYRLRPFTSRWLRKNIQRLRAANWQGRQFPRWPVDTTVENICESLLLLTLRASRVERVPFIWFWPGGARGCISMTHDVEALAGRDFCDQLMDIDDSYGIKASFQIVPERRYPVTTEFLSGIRDRGFEVCVQDLNHDGCLFDERAEFLRRVEHINRYGREFCATGYRSAVLYRKPEWYKDFDFSFDMSYPNVAHLDPQRGGCCTVMPYFIGKVLELPVTTVQDYTLFHILDDYSIDLWKKQIELILAKNGLVSFIVHPDYIVESEAQSVYKDLLAVLKDLRGREALWFALPGEIDCWWRARSLMSVVERDGSWEIVGDGSERAVLAFAREVDGELIYEMADMRNGELHEAAPFCPGNQIVTKP